MLTVVADPEVTPAVAVSSESLIDEIVRDGARRMLAAALEAEVAAYIDAHADQLDEHGRRLVVRNGHAVARQVLTSAGAVQVRAPRVNDKRVDEVTGERQRFCSAILPAWCRKSPKVTEVLPLLYLHGLSSKDFGPALEGFFGTDAGLSAATITRLTLQWQDEARAFEARDLSNVDYIYLWADGIHVGIRLDEEKLCLLVLIGVRVDGTKELIALADGYRESTGSWADLLRDCKRRGMRAPVLAVGDGALGFWSALREVFPETKEQRCWFHKIANVLSAMPKSAHPGAKKALAEIWNAEDREHARRAVAAFKLAYGAKFGKGRREDHRRSGRVAGVLRFPGGALDPFAHNESHRVDLRYRQASHEGHQRAGVEGRRPGHGVQAHRGRAGPLARGQRPTPRRACPSRCQVHQRQARRARHRPGQHSSRGRIVKISHPQVLTIAPAPLLSTGREQRGQVAPHRHK